MRLGAWRVITVVSGRLRAWAKRVKFSAVSPRPWRRRRRFVGGCWFLVFVFVLGFGGGLVIVRGRLGGKSA